MLAGVHDPRRGVDAERAAVAAAAEPAGHSPPAIDAAVLAVAGDAEVRAATAGDLRIVLDGRVYNLGELAGGEIAPEDEAETLARLWNARGEALLPALRGDFVLIAWDRRAAGGIVARDQMSGRGLVYHARDGRLAFASEARQLLRLLPSRPGPDRAALAHWLAVSGVPEDRTLFEGVRRLEPAHLLRLGPEGAAAPERYWFPRYERPLRGSRPELATHLRETLALAVERRLEGPASAVMLSGGLDSSTVAALASRAGERRPRRSYSAVFPDHPTIDETELVGELADTFGLDATSAVVRSGSVLSGALAYVDQWALPPMSPNLFFWIPLLERAASDGVRVMLDGEGGDELFGLSIHLLSDRLMRGRLLSAIELTRRTPLEVEHSWAITRRLLIRYGLRGAAPAGLHALSRRVRPEQSYAPPWFRPETARALLDVHEAAAWKRLDGPRWWAGLVDAVVGGMGPALGYDHVRRRAALAGIAPRHPLVDVDVIELMLRMPPETAFHPLHTRPMVREAMEGLIPDSVRLRPTKSSFDALFHESIAGVDLAAVRELIDRPDAEVGAFVDLAVLRRELFGAPPPSSDPRALQDWALRVWRTVTAEVWLREQSAPGFAAELLANAQLAAPDLVLARNTA